MASTPIIIPMFVPRHTTSTIVAGPSRFIESYDDTMININAATECGVYLSGGEYWIWFKINGTSKYYEHGFSTKMEAQEKLNEFLK